jgi:hypothetical protein
MQICMKKGNLELAKEFVWQGNKASDGDVAQRMPIVIEFRRGFVPAGMMMPDQ